MSLTFSHDWFSGNIGNWTQWLAKFKGQPINALEIGCYEGRASTWLLANILTHPQSTLTVCDTFAGSEEHKELGVPFTTVYDTFRANVAPWSKRVFIFTGESEKTVRHFTHPYHLVYIDGSHLAPDTLTDACLIWPLVPIGGIVIFDDYAWDHYLDPTHNPRLGIDAFRSVFKDRYKLIGEGYQVCLEKTA